MRYAALAYDPSESSFFRIVQFGLERDYNLYSSETRRWSPKVWAGDYFADHVCVRQSSYCKGAMYSLTKKGRHLVRLSLEDARVREIDLPAAITEDNGRVGINNGRIHLMVFDHELDLCVWVLDSISCQWSMRRKLSGIYQTCGFGRNFHIMMGFHPYQNIVFIDSNTDKGEPSLACVDFGGDEFCARKDGYELKRIPFTSFPYERHYYIQSRHVLMFSVFDCSLPFATGLSTDDPGKRTDPLCRGPELIVPRFLALL